VKADSHKLPKNYLPILNKFEGYVQFRCPPVVLLSQNTLLNSLPDLTASINSVHNEDPRDASKGGAEYSKKNILRSMIKRKMKKSLETA
jgi:hypothetical protein